METKKLLSVKELAAELNIAPISLYKNLDKIPHCRILNCVRFDRDEVMAYFKNRKDGKDE